MIGIYCIQQFNETQYTNSIIYMRLNTQHLYFLKLCTDLSQYVLKSLICCTSHKLSLVIIIAKYTYKPGQTSLVRFDPSIPSLPTLIEHINQKARAKWMIDYQVTYQSSVVLKREVSRQSKPGQYLPVLKHEAA